MGRQRVRAGPPRPGAPQWDVLFLVRVLRGALGACEQVQGSLLRSILSAWVHWRIFGKSCGFGGAAGYTYRKRLQLRRKG